MEKLKTDKRKIHRKITAISAIPLTNYYCIWDYL